tara:strand:- start:126 stop:392 length:267 start_codon:yes stop_codon:yes gene_type:complete
MCQINQSLAGNHPRDGILAVENATQRRQDAFTNQPFFGAVKHREEAQTLGDVLLNSSVVGVAELTNHGNDVEVEELCVLRRAAPRRAK